MEFGEIFQIENMEALSILLSVFFSVVAFGISFSSLKRAKRLENLQKRPGILISGLTIAPSKVNVYVDEMVNPHERGLVHYVGGLELYANIISENDLYIVSKSTECISKITNYLMKEEFLLINTCIKKEMKYEYPILAYGVLNIGLRFVNAKVNNLKIQEIYFKIDGEKKKNYKFNHYTGKNVEFLISGDSIEISIAYACFSSQDLLMDLYNIHDLSKDKSSTVIDFLESKGEAENYMNFKEATFLLQCTTSNNDTYYYSLLLRQTEGMLEPPQIYNDRSLFDENVKRGT